MSSPSLDPDVEQLADDVHSPARSVQFDTDDNEVNAPPSQPSTNEPGSGLRDRAGQRSSSSVESTTVADPPSALEKKPPPPPLALSPFDPLTLALLSLFSILGCLCRLGLTALFTYSGQAVFPLIWSQAVGCFLMGLAQPKKAGVDASVLGPAVFVGWTTGLCGSITTFSSWIVQTFGAFSNLEGVARSGVHDVRLSLPTAFLFAPSADPTNLILERWAQAADGITHLVLTFALSLFSLSFGRHMSSYLPSFPSLVHLPRRSTCLAAVALGAGTYLSSILALALSSKQWTGNRILFALVLAPPGTVLRWWIARLNSLSPQIPTGGTFTANMLATLLLAVSYLLQRIVPLGTNLTGTQCKALQAVEDGFCGSLSTVSTFAVELDALFERRRRPSTNEKSEREGWVEREAWAVYATGSVGLGLVVVLLILGVGKWASPHGLGPVCSFY